jgi:uncharacterized protein
VDSPHRVDHPPAADQVQAQTLAWIDRAVIGLNLCPFARAVRAKGQLRCVVSDATDAEALLRALCDEAQRLLDTEPTQWETTVLVHPQVLTDFADHNDFLDAAEAALGELGCDGVLQLASFHPAYQFADTEPGDIANATNRSPYPTLHLLREVSVDRAVDSFPDAASIYEANIATLRTLGDAGWQSLREACERDATATARTAPRPPTT